MPLGKRPEIDASMLLVEHAHKCCQFLLNKQVPVFKIAPLSQSLVPFPCHFTLLCCGWRQQRHSHLTAGCLDGQRWGGKTQTVPLPPVSMKRSGYNVRKEDKKSKSKVNLMSSTNKAQDFAGV